MHSPLHETSSEISDAHLRVDSQRIEIVHRRDRISVAAMWLGVQLAWLRLLSDFGDQDVSEYPLFLNCSHFTADIRV